jgi:hypothetical protein
MRAPFKTTLFDPTLHCDRTTEGSAGKRQMNDPLCNFVGVGSFGLGSVVVVVVVVGRVVDVVVVLEGVVVVVVVVDVVVVVVVVDDVGSKVTGR